MIDFDWILQQHLSAESIHGDRLLQTRHSRYASTNRIPGNGIERVLQPIVSQQKQWHSEFPNAEYPTIFLRNLSAASIRVPVGSDLSAKWTTEINTGVFREHFDADTNHHWIDDISTKLFQAFGRLVVSANRLQIRNRLDVLLLLLHCVGHDCAIAFMH